VSGEKKRKKTQEELAEVSTLFVWPRFLSVRSLSVALTAGRCWIRRNHIRSLPDLITLQRGGRIDSKGSGKPSYGTGEPRDDGGREERWVTRTHTTRKEKGR
jgi:hypothetical protein